MQLNVERELERCARVMRQRLLPKIDQVVGEVKVRGYVIKGEPIRSAEFFTRLQDDQVNFIPLHIGDIWGTTWGTTWMEITGSLSYPEQTQTPVEMMVDLGWRSEAAGGHYEALAYRPDGSIIKAVNPKNQWIPLGGHNKEDDPAGDQASVLKPDGSFTIYLEAACNPFILGDPAFTKTELGGGTTGRADESNLLKRMDVCHFDREAWDYYVDLDVVCQLIRESNSTEPRYWQLGKALQGSLNLYDEGDLSSLKPARQALSRVLALPAVPSALDQAAVGHSHIDSAWLWPKRETRRKVARTVSNALSLMEGDPNFIYAMSSAQQFAWLEEDHPKLFKKVLNRIRQGRFIPVGGMWVESDGMMPSGESLTRQFSFGKRYFREHLGVDTEVVWEPDSFGYTGQFPQIARRAGMTAFLSQKISWNDTTRFPHHTFDWQGIDGTPIFTHFPPMDTYASTMTARELNYSEENYQDKDISTRALVLFGYGDGGGGPTREMLGRYDRLHDVEGCSKVRYQSPQDFFREANTEIRIQAGTEMPVWKGELYLELHRKTLTTQQEMKRGSRQEESMLRAVEYLCAYAGLADPSYSYPKKDLDEIWKTLLLNQFHDILPGSAISWVHRQAREDYKRDIQRLSDLGRHAGEVIAAACPQAPLLHQAKVIPMTGLAQDAWQPVEALMRPKTPEEIAEVRLYQEGNHYIIDNGLIRLLLCEDGEIHSILDRTSDRDLIPAGSTMGGYELLKDEPYKWDAWDMDRDALLTAQKISDPVRIEVVDGSLQVSRRHDQTSIVTTISLAPGIRQVHFEAQVDWQQDEQVLKVDLPLSIQARYAQFECQYGFIDRPIQKNSEAEEAQYESCTHRFVRLVDDNLALGVVNASTYGADTMPIYYDQDRGCEAGTMVRLTLLSASVYPDPKADRGSHDFAWSLVPGRGQEEILHAAYALNAPTFSDLPAVDPLVSLQQLQGLLVIDWIKPADDGSGDLILRVCNPDSSPAKSRLHLGQLLKDTVIYETNSLEDGPVPQGVRQGLKADGGSQAEGALLDMVPFQFTTLRLSKTRSPEARGD